MQDQNLELLLNTPVPEATKSYSPVSHKQVIDATKERLDKLGMKTVKEVYKHSAKGKEMVGYFSIANGNDDFRYQIAFRNSYNKTMAVTYGSGMEVAVCGNMQILKVGDELYSKKHINGIQAEMNEMLDNVMSNMEWQKEHFRKKMNSFASLELEEENISKIIGDLYLYKGLLNNKQMTIVADELKNPSFDYGTDGNTLYDIYNYCTHAYKTNAAYYDFQHSHELLETFENYYGAVK